MVRTMPDKKKQKQKQKQKEQVEARPPVHEVAIAILEEAPDHVHTIAFIYSRRAKVPEEAVSDVVKALERAHGRIHPTVTVYFQDAIDALHEQREKSGN